MSSVLSVQQIQAFTERAKAAGYSDISIKQAIQKKQQQLIGQEKQQEMLGTRPAPQPIQTQATPTQTTTGIPSTRGTTVPAATRPTGVTTTTPTTPQTAEGQSTYITGHSLADYSRAIQKAMAAGDKNAVKQLNDFYDREYQYQKDTGLSKKQKDAAVTRQDTLDRAREVLRVIDQGEKGELTGKQYKDALNSAVSMYTAAKGFGEGGKSLTAPELAILAGQLPVTRKKTGTPLEKAKAWLGGYEVPQTGEVAEDERTIRNKMIRVVNTLDPTANLSYPGSEEEFKKQKIKGEAAPEEVNWNIVENALNEVVDFAVAAPEAMKLIAGLTPPGQLIRSLQGKDTTKEDYEALKGFMGGLIEDIGKTTGISMDENNKVHFDPKAAATHNWNHPLSTLGYILPFMKIAKAGTISKAAKIAKTGTEIEKGAEAINFIKPAAKSGVMKNIEGRLATSVAAPVPTSVAKSEALMKDALQITKSVTPRGLAKELETFTPKVGKAIDEYAMKLDDVIGPQSMDEVINAVNEKIGASSVAQTAPDLVETINQILRDNLNVGGLPGGMARGDVFATTISKMNEARKFFNKSVPNKWFEKGQEVVSRADQLNSLKWEASNALKDIMTEADKSGYFNRAISLQHSALSTSPILSKTSLATGKFATSIPGAVNSIWNNVIKIPRTVAARKMAGKPSGLTKSIVKGETPIVEGTIAKKATSLKTQKLKGLSKPLDESIINRMLNKKGPAQKARLLKDTGYDLSASHTRAEQDKLLRASRMKKYD